MVYLFFSVLFDDLVNSMTLEKGFLKIFGDALRDNL